MRKLNNNSVLLLSLLILFILGFNACKDDADDADNNTLTQQDRTFVTNASASNISEVEFGRLALQKATHDSVKYFAQAMVTEHTRAQAQLDSISNILNIVTSDSMDVAHRTLLNTLSGLSSSAFDSAYIQNQVLDHQAAQTLLQNEISNGKDTRLVSYSNKTLPAVKRHLDQANRIKNLLTQPMR